MFQLVFFFPRLVTSARFQYKRVFLWYFNNGGFIFEHQFSHLKFFQFTNNYSWVLTRQQEEICRPRCEDTCPCWTVCFRIWESVVAHHSGTTCLPISMEMRILKQTNTNNNNNNNNNNNKNRKEQTMPNETFTFFIIFPVHRYPKITARVTCIIVNTAGYNLETGHYQIRETVRWIGLRDFDRDHTVASCRIGEKSTRRQPSTEEFGTSRRRRRRSRHHEDTKGRREPRDGNPLDYFRGAIYILHSRELDFSLSVCLNHVLLPCHPSRRATFGPNIVVPIIIEISPVLYMTLLIFRNVLSIKVLQINIFSNYIINHFH